MATEDTEAAVSGTTVACAFCRGLGRDPFGIMSWVSTCYACHGTGRHRLPRPRVLCAYCAGTGVSPVGARTYCAACHGAGALTAPRSAGECPACAGSGAGPGSLYCLRCRGAGQVGAWL